MTTSAADREAGLRERDEAVKAAWHALISAKVASWNTLERELGDSYGLGVSDFEVLDHLASRPDGCRAQNLAKRCTSARAHCPGSRTGWKGTAWSSGTTA
jgi:hypothetical protein